MKILRLFLFMMLVPVTIVFSQKANTTVTYEELYDAPYEINKLFVQFQPIYGEVFVTNVNMGFGGEVTYYHKNKLDFRASARLPYYRSMDFERDIALKNIPSNDASIRVFNNPNKFSYFEAGATYHIIDVEKESKSKLPLYSSNYKGSRLASKVLQKAEVPNKKREVIGVRLGGIYFDAATDLTRVVDKQNLKLGTSTGDTLQLGDLPRNFFGNISGPIIYVGGSLSWIKNYAAKPDKTYAVITDDLILTGYADIMISPWMVVQDISMGNLSGGPVQKIDGKQFKTNFMGFRLGIDGKFNREFGWAYGAEFGLRPSVKGRGNYAMIKISFPVYSTNLDYTVEAFGK